MFSPKEIMLLNLVFSSSLGFVALLLFAGSVRRPSPLKRAELFLSVRKGGVLFRRIPVGKGRYRIGRGNECDILLEGAGIPVVAGELLATNTLFFRSLSGQPVTKNRRMTSPEFELMPGDEIGFCDYSMKVESN